MQRSSTGLAESLAQLVEKWSTELPSHAKLLDQADHVASAARDAEAGLWAPEHPRLVTATLDDGIGQGLQIVERYAALAGMQVLPLGLNRTVAEIVTACERNRPHMVGLTVLQFDTLEEVALLAEGLPDAVTIVVGGPVFKRRPSLAVRHGAHLGAGSILEFLEFLLSWRPSE